jgi:hypothetical protein
VAELWRELFYCGAKEFNCGGAATLNGLWRTLIIHALMIGVLTYNEIEAIFFIIDTCTFYVYKLISP